VSVDAAGLGADTASLEPEWMAPGNEAPALSSYLPADGEPVAINDTATIMATDPVTTANIAVLDNDLRDGTLLDPADVVRVEIEQAPTDGNAVINLDNSITYTPALGFTGTALFEYRVTTLDNNNDEAFSVAAVKVTVEAAPIPDAPQAVSDSANAFEETAVTLDVLTNDSLNNDTATTVLVEIVDDAVNGTAVVNVDNSITYTPNAGFVSTDTITAIERFTYQVTVDGKVSNAALVSVRVLPEPDLPLPTGGSSGGSSSGCSVGNPNGPFDPMLPGLLALALAGLFLRRRHA